MTEAEAIEVLTDAFTDGWELLHPDDASDPDYCPVALEGETFAALPTWVRFSIVAMTGEQRSMGGEGERLTGDSGMIAVQVFCEVNEGTGARAQLCDDVRTVLQLKSFYYPGIDEPVRVFKGVSQNPGTEGRWLTQNVLLPYDIMGTA